MRRFILVIAFALLPFSAVGAEEKYATSAQIDRKQASLAVSSADCAESGECIVASLSCSEAGGFVATIDALKAEEAGKWLVKTGGRASLATDARTFELEADKLQFTEMDATWQLQLKYGPAAEIWKMLSGAKTATLSAGAAKRPIPADKNLRKVAAACGKR
jgi:hypothetical protein